MGVQLYSFIVTIPCATAAWWDACYCLQVGSLQGGSYPPCPCAPAPRWAPRWSPLTVLLPATACYCP